MYSARANTLRSLAVVFCWLFGRPDALRNLVFDIPSTCASRVICSAKADSDPEENSDKAVATSFADFVVRASIASRNVIDSPDFRPIFEGGCRAARADIGTIELRKKSKGSRVDVDP